MSFSIDWLDLRESSDHAARDPELLQLSLDWLAQENNRTVVDLGCGTGSTLRAFGKTAPDLRWRLVDMDPDLLAEAVRRHSNIPRLKTHTADIAQFNRLPFAGAGLVTASALFDLVSREFCDVLIHRLQGRGIALYAALNYDGITTWDPAHPLDAAVLQSFNRDQLRDKGLGPALGPEATDYLATALENAGFRIFRKPSPWQLAAENQALVEELVRGVASAVACDQTIDEQSLQAWLRFRLEHAASGKCTVGHWDLLALPG